MYSQVAKWGNSQGVRLPKSILQIAGIQVDDSVELIAQNKAILIKPSNSQSLSWYLAGYENELDRYEWADDEPKGRELL